MFYIIESEYQLDYLEGYVENPTYIEILTGNKNYHPSLTEVVAVYVRPVKQDTGYIIPISHDEGLNVGKNRVYELLNKYKTLYVVNKKELYYHFKIPSAIDLQLVETLTTGNKIEFPRENKTIEKYYNTYPNLKEIGKVIPITKLYENCENNYKAVEKVIKYELPKGFDFYNKLATGVFYLLEQPGLVIDTENYVKQNKITTPEFNIKENKIYTSYNLYNKTSRPTNTFNSINFAAIPKTKEYRELIKPENDYFVEADYDGYHIRLLCEQIGYELTDEPAHTQLAKLYFNKEVISEEEYTEAKQINFQAIYGKIPAEYKSLEFFKKIQKHINMLWETYEQQKYVLDPISGKEYKNTSTDMHPQKLMNYLIQSLETSRNILTLKDLLEYLTGKKTKVVLYTYDSFLIDFALEDGKETLIRIQEIMESGGKYPIKIKHGKSMNF